MNEIQKCITCLEALDQFTAQFKCLLKPGDRLYLKGDLGAGKTAFTRSLLKAYGVLQGVKSPTYTLVETYPIDSSVIYHFDFYRFKSPYELFSMGIEDYDEPEAIWIVEWPEKAEYYLPPPDFCCHIAVISEHERALHLKSSRSLSGYFKDLP